MLMMKYPHLYQKQIAKYWITNLSIWDNTIDYASCEDFCESCSFQWNNVHYEIMVVITKSIVVIHKQLQMVLLVIL